MTTVEIDPSTICVTFARPAGLEEVKSYFETLVTLSDDEIRRVERFHFERDRRLFVASRALVRRTLSRFVDVEPAAWRFDTDLHGRPYIVFPTEGRMLRFSASRTEGLVMCAVALNRDVGADVERLRECPLDVVDSSFAPVEAQSVHERSGIEQSERFFTYWTLKESYVKARGLGLYIPLDKFAFQLSEDQPPRLEIDTLLDDQAWGWRFRSLRPTLTHLAALCVYIPDQPTVDISPSWG
jgi:4'-phosphopantetheinyl transferase